MTDYNVQLEIQAAKRVSATREAMKELINTMNIMGGDDDFAQGIFEALANEHRTLQQSAVKAFANAMIPLSEINTDLRNEATIDFAKKGKAMEHFFPSV